MTAKENSEGDRSNKDNKSNRADHTVVIVGGGFSGAMTAAHLLRESKKPLAITLYEPRPVAGKGLAYSTPSDGHLLNVPAGGMSAFPEDLEHFKRWATERDTATTSQTFVPRKVFGQYVSGLLTEAKAACGQSTLIHSNETVENIVRQNNRFLVTTKEENSIEADVVVLALGNMAGKLPRWYRELIANSGKDLAANYLHDPWEAGAIEGIGLDEDVLLIGTGLTSVDKLIELDLKGHRGKIYAASRHGLWPCAHWAPFVGKKEETTVPSGNLLTAMRSLRRQIRERQAKTGEVEGWRLVFDGLRPHTQSWWQALPLPEKKRFLRHVRTYYDIHRHRMAPQIGAVVDRLRHTGKLTTMAARLTAVTVKEGRFEVSLQRRHHSESEIFQFDRIINCMGPQANIDALQNPLPKKLVDSGLVGRNKLGSGLAVTPDGEILSPDGVVVEGLYAVGPALIGKLLESVAVPELKIQAANIAAKIN